MAGDSRSPLARSQAKGNLSMTLGELRQPSGKIDADRSQLGRCRSPRGTEHLRPRRVARGSGHVGGDHMKSKSLLHRRAENLTAIHPGADRPLRSDAVDGVPRQSRRMSQAGALATHQRGKQHERVRQGVIDIFVTNVCGQMPKLKTDFFTNRGEHGQKVRIVPCELGTRTIDQLTGNRVTGGPLGFGLWRETHGNGLQNSADRPRPRERSVLENTNRSRVHAGAQRLLSNLSAADLCGSKHSEHGSKAHRSCHHGLTSAARSKPRIRTDRFFSEAT